jgi:hypothetical protein
VSPLEGVDAATNGGLTLCGLVKNRAGETVENHYAVTIEEGVYTFWFSHQGNRI